MQEEKSDNPTSYMCSLFTNNAHLTHDNSKPLRIPSFGIAQLGETSVGSFNDPFRCRLESPPLPLEAPGSFFWPGASIKV